jgi:hypothetical protein
MTVFAQTGKENTEKVVNIALTEAAKRGIHHIVVASYTGYTADFFREASGLNIVVVRGTYGFTEPNVIRMSEDEYNALIACGMKIVTAAHALSGAERAFSNTFKGAYPAEIVAHTLRMFGHRPNISNNLPIWW